MLGLSFAFSPASSQAQLIKSSTNPIGESKSEGLISRPAPAGLPRIQSPQLRSGSAHPITLADAVSIFLKQNFQLIAARYDIDTAEAEKLTARLRPNPDVSVGFSGLPLNLSGNLLAEQQYSYSIAQTFELGGKRAKRIDVANANTDVAHAQFEMAVWQLTNDLKRKFYAVILNQALLNLAKENETTFAETVKHTNELVQAGEISGLDLTRLEVEKLKFDTDLANAERDYEIALRDLRVTLGGDYRSMDIDAAGSLDPQTYDFTFADLRDQALAARPDLKAAKLSERAADAAINLQDAQRIPDLSLGAGLNQVPEGGSTYTFGVGVTLPIHDRNQGERAKARIDRERALNQERLVTNQIISDVDKALIAFQMQKRRVDLYRTGVLTKVNDIQNLTEYSLKAGESSILDLLDAIRTRRDTLAAFYQTLFDYQSALLDLELATATPLIK
jgi:cobalt-zinc-cadmium efflux system outer membrane protein